jgi:ribosome biogenesis protein Nip4
VKSYFDDLQPELFEILANTNNFLLYQFEGIDHEVFLVPRLMNPIVKKLTKDVELKHAGIHLGYLRRKTTKTQFVRAFFLSFEGGEFLLQFLKTKAPKIHDQLQLIQLDEKGEKDFLYGREIDLDFVLTDTSNIQKHRLIFIHDQNMNYLGLGLLRVKRAGSTKSEEEFTPKTQDSYSRSRHFLLSILNLTDAGYFIRSGH